MPLRTHSARNSNIFHDNGEMLLKRNEDVSPSSAISLKKSSMLFFKTNSQAGKKIASNWCTTSTELSKDKRTVIMVFKRPKAAICLSDKSS
ncbi:hypothetical protein WICPIJ_004205 [Wickerhamomyces pijperi]|uniref:Uncharacterized protein n=1 Tax=Wickerhamomyces pijperi TaxID=599730 RepID=A0A9P8Q878_WICPI|nr:hypothetical protein WICPIJ_004205 [Wickerhamomyces pijperi]